MALPQEKQKICLAYSGGLDTSAILAWLLEAGHEVVCFCADIGQEEKFDEVKEKALRIGASAIEVVDVRREFVTELLWPAIQCNAAYQESYLMGTSLARPVIARAQIEVAVKYGCNAVAHGATGKGNDQVRFELAFYALQPSINVIAPWRIPAFYQRFRGRNDLLDYAAQQKIPVTSTKKQPWSMDENLAHCSYEAGILEDPSTPAPKDLWKLTSDPERAPEQGEDITVTFEKGIPIALSFLDGGSEKVVKEPLELFLAANTLARRHGVGRVDIVEDRLVGIKSRGCYETPGLTILRSSHLDLEGLVLDREVRALRDQFVSFNWSKLLYNGLYFSPEREFLHDAILSSQKMVNGEVKLRLYRGSVKVLSRKSESKLYDPLQSSMDDIEGFEPTETTGFIGITAIRIKNWALGRKL